MRTVTVEVTQKHIDNGSPRMKCFCPVAQALTDALGYRYVSVSKKVFETERGFKGLLPVDASNAIFTFDTTGEMEPFSFTVEVPE